jgi:hypothetical protein
MGIYDDSTGTVVPVPGPDLIAAVANANYATNQFKGIGDIGCAVPVSFPKSFQQQYLHNKF